MIKSAATRIRVLYRCLCRAAKKAEDIISLCLSVCRQKAAANTSPQPDTEQGYSRKTGTQTNASDNPIRIIPVSR